MLQVLCVNGDTARRPMTGLAALLSARQTPPPAGTCLGHAIITAAEAFHPEMAARLGAAAGWALARNTA